MSRRPTGSATGETVTVRPIKSLIVAWVGAVILVGLFAWIALLLRSRDTGVYFQIADQVSMMVLGLFIAGGVLLLARPRVRGDAAGIEVRNIVLTRRFDWNEVLRISFPDSAPWARLDLPDDEYIPVMAIQAVDGRRAVDGITRLRALHAAARRD